MNRNETENTLDVAILMDDLNEIKKIAQVFRKIGIIPNFYNDLKSFWYDTLERTPAICLIDVMKMSEGELALKSHPKVKNDSMPVVFYHTDSTAPLLFSTYEIFNYGVLKKSDDYTGVVKNILRRVNKFVELEDDNKNLSKMRTELDKHLNKIVGATSKYRENEFFNSKLNDICNSLEDQRTKSFDLFNACNAVFSSFNEIVKYSFVELSYNGQKLISPDSTSIKYKKIPTLWLGQTSKNGIQNFAQNMANQVSVDLLGGHVMSLMIKGKFELPDKIIFIQSEDEEWLDNFDWNSFERYLSGLNNFFELKNSPVVADRSEIIQPWELMSILDRYFFGAVPNEAGTAQIKDDIYLIDVDLTSLLDIVRSKITMRFFWSNFFTEFVNKFKAQYSNFQFRVSCMSIDHMGFVVNKEVGNDFFVAIKSYCSRYPYWRHFEDVDLVLARDIKPIIKMIPLSPEAYMRYVDGLENTYSSVNNKSVTTEQMVDNFVKEKPLSESVQPQL